MSLVTKGADMTASEDRMLTARHWILISAAGVLVAILFARTLAYPTDWGNAIVAVAALAVAVTSLLSLRKRRQAETR